MTNSTAYERRLTSAIARACSCEVRGQLTIFAPRHDRQVQHAHFDLLASDCAAAANPATKPTTQASTCVPTGKQTTTENPENQAAFSGCGIRGDPMKSAVMGATGLEPVTSAM
jgi:hypothetical protein